MRLPRWLLLLVCFAGTAFALADDAQPRDVRLVEKKFEQLANQDSDPLGTQALAIDPDKWKHAETEHFIVHYRRATEAQKVVRELEFSLWYVARALGATKEQYAKKSHVYVFKDEREWRTFVYKLKMPDWVASFAHGDELFLHVGGAGEEYNSDTLAHETTHAVVARLYPRKRWPRWLNEGFAEYMGTASQAARKKIWAKGMQKQIEGMPIPLKDLLVLTDYPTQQQELNNYYQSCEKLVRFLMDDLPRERFPVFVDTILNGTPFEQAVPQVYAPQVKDYADFLKRFEKK